MTVLGAGIPLPHYNRLTVARGRSQKRIRVPERVQPMRLCWKGFAAPVLLLAGLAWPLAARATSCTTQAELLPQDRNELTAAGGRLAAAVAEQDFDALKAALLPALAQDWDGMRGVVESSASLMKGGQIQIRSLYLLDASSLAAPADTQFFCTNASGSITVTLTMRALPPVFPDRKVCDFLGWMASVSISRQRSRGVGILKPVLLIRSSIRFRVRSR